LTTAAVHPAEVPAPKRRSRWLALALLLLVAPCLLTGLVAVVVKVYVVQAFFIQAPSMEPTLQVGDRVLVNKLAGVERGDIIVFERLPEEHAAIKDLIKRVVAIEGDTIESRGTTLFVNDQAVVEPYVTTSSIGNPVVRKTVPPGHVYVMGDNRPNSQDSRVFGPVHEDRIVGRAVLKIWPSLERL
jgi:signal peptidase I